MPRPCSLTTLPLAALLSLGTAVEAREKNPLDELLSENVLPVTFSEGKLGGPGGERLLASARAAEMVLIGESHGNRETPRLSSALLGALRPHGFGTLAVETGPVVTERLVELARDPAGLDAFHSFLQKYPFTFAFFWWKEEIEMLRTAVAEGYAVWGLDQEFVGSARYLLSELSEGLAGEEREQAEAWLVQAREGFREFSEGGNRSAGFLNVVDPEELRRFAAGLSGTKVRERRIVEELAASAEVYQHFGAGRYYLNNRDRIRLMKRHFVEYAEAAGGIESMPKVILKFGTAHMGRGYSPFHQLDLGNQAAELSVARGGDSYHLLVTTRRSVNDGETRDWAKQVPHLELFDVHRQGDGWALFDLTALRPFFAVKSNRETHPQLAEQVFRFDALLMAPVFHAAESLIPLPF